MQTILGAGGVIANELAFYLREYTDKVRLVSRNPVKCHPEDELLSADLTDKAQTLKAIAGSEIVYLTAGFPYDINSWRKFWPLAMRNVIEGCREHGAKLVFFDNIYMYNPEKFSKIDENTLVKPVSKKGLVRQEIADMLLNSTHSGEIEALIARCADYYGPSIDRNSMLNELVVKNYAAGKKANWLGPLHFKHSFTYSKDAARATALLGNTTDAYGEVWHLPTDPNALSAQEIVDVTANYFGTEPKVRVNTPMMVGLVGLFVPVMKEIKEMMYQYDRDYIFDSSKFDQRFDFQTTTYTNGLREMLEHDYPKK